MRKTKKEEIKKDELGYMTLYIEVKDVGKLPYRVFCGTEIRSVTPLFYKNEVDAFVNGTVFFPANLHITHIQHIQSVAQIIQLVMGMEQTQRTQTVYTYQNKPTAKSSSTPKNKQPVQINISVKNGDMLNGIHVVHQEHPQYKLGIMDSAGAHFVGNGGFTHGSGLHSMYQRITDLIVSEAEFAKTQPDKWEYKLADLDGKHTIADPVLAIPQYRQPFLHYNQTLCHNNLTVFKYNNIAGDSVSYSPQERYQIAMAMTAVTPGINSANEEDRRKATEKLATELKDGMKAELEALKAAKVEVVLASAYACGGSYHHEKTIAKLFWEVWYGDGDGYYKDFKALRFFMPAKQAKIFITEFHALASQTLGLKSVVRTADSDLFISGTPDDLTPDTPNDIGISTPNEPINFSQVWSPQPSSSATTAVTTTTPPANLTGSLLLDFNFSNQPTNTGTAVTLGYLQGLTFHPANETPAHTQQQDTLVPGGIQWNTTATNILSPVVSPNNIAIPTITATTTTTALPLITAAIGTDDASKSDVSTSQTAVTAIQEQVVSKVDGQNKNALQ